MLAGAAAVELPPITPADRNKDLLPLSFAQQRLWFLAQLEGVGTAYHISGGLRLKGDLDRSVLLRALDRIVERLGCMPHCRPEQARHDTQTEQRNPVVVSEDGRGCLCCNSNVIHPVLCSEHAHDLR